MSNKEALVCVIQSGLKRVPPFRIFWINFSAPGNSCLLLIEMHTIFFLWTSIFSHVCFITIDAINEIDNRWNRLKANVCEWFCWIYAIQRSGRFIFNWKTFYEECHSIYKMFQITAWKGISRHHPLTYL